MTKSGFVENLSLHVPLLQTALVQGTAHLSIDNIKVGHNPFSRFHVELEAHIVEFICHLFPSNSSHRSHLCAFLVLQTGTDRDLSEQSWRGDANSLIYCNREMCTPLVLWLLPVV